MAVVAALAAVSAGLDVFGGLMGYFTSGFGAAIAESRGRMLRLEADTEAQQYREQAESFRSSQAVAYTKSGVRLEGSPLTILDETILTASENISAIRARGRAQEFEYYTQAEDIRNKGRMGLLGGIAKGGATLASYGFGKGAPAAKTAPTSTGGGYNYQYKAPRVHRGVPAPAELY